MPKIFIQGENAASVARAYVFGNNSTVAGSDARGIAATSNLSGSNRQRQAALARAYDAATEPAAKQAALDGIAFYAFQQAVVTAQGSGDSDNYEIERPADYAQYAQQALATARGYAAEEASQAREAQTVRARAAEQTRLANRAPQARALDDRFGEDTGRGRISAQSERGQAMAVLNQYFNTLPANITGDVRYNRARNGIDNELERVDTSMWNSSARENALRSARSILDSQQELERTQAATRPPAAPAAVTGNSEHVPLHGSPNNHYGQRVNIGNPVTARNTARVAILSAGFGDNNSQHFNRAQVNAILADIDPQEQYTNAQLRNLHDQREAATSQASKNNFTAVIGVLTLENRFARARAAGDTSLTMFANNQEVVSFYQNALRQAGTYAVDDQTVAAAPAGAGGPVARDVPPASAGPDNEAYGPYRGQTYAASSTPRGTVREAQLLLEALGPEYTSGSGNTRRFGEGQKESSAMDGIVGEKTDAAIKRFQTENGITPANGQLDEATMAKLHEKADARLAAAGQTTDGADTVAGGASDVAQTPPDLRTQLAPQLEAVANLSDTPLTLAELSSQRAALTAALTNSGLSAEKLAEFNACSNVNVFAGTCTNDILGGVERALGLTVDSKPDPRLIALLTDPVSGPAIANAINAGSITAVASAASAGAPGGNGAGGQATAR